jgi:carbon storage regulator
MRPSLSPTASNVADRGATGHGSQTACQVRCRSGNRGIGDNHLRPSGGESGAPPTRQGAEKPGRQTSKDRRNSFGDRRILREEPVTTPKPEGHVAATCLRFGRWVEAVGATLAAFCDSADVARSQNAAAPGPLRHVSVKQAARRRPPTACDLDRDAPMQASSPLPLRALKHSRGPDLPPIWPLRRLLPAGQQLRGPQATTRYGMCTTLPRPTVPQRACEGRRAMLVLSRKLGEEVLIGHHVRLVIRRIAGNRVTIGVVAPKDVPIVRGELRPRVAPSEDTPARRTSAPAV